jgi:outer membrane lipoprotein-sorting protein
MKNIGTVILLMLLAAPALRAQSADELLSRVKAKLDKVNDYQATGKMKTNVIFIKAPVATVKVYYKKPDKLRINNESGISFVPRGSININLNNLFLAGNGFDKIDLGKEAGSNLRIIKLLPKDDNGDVVLSTLYIDEKLAVIRKATTTTRDNGTYELEMTYGKYADYGLADKVNLSFNTKDFKLPKGVTFDYDDGTKKDTDKTKARKGKVEIVYSSYIINKGVPDSVFR